MGKDDKGEITFKICASGVDLDVHVPFSPVYISQILH